MCRSWSQAFHGNGPSTARSLADDVAEQEQRVRELERLAADQRLVGEPARAVDGGAHAAALGDDELAQELATRSPDSRATSGGRSRSQTSCECECGRLEPAAAPSLISAWT